MGKVKTKKEHKKRVAKRNNILNQERKRFEKDQKNFILKLIEEEKNKGLFDNQPISHEQLFPSTDMPSLSQPEVGLFNGPRI
jgi:hypothetical protein